MRRQSKAISSAPKKKSILIVDDHPGFRKDLIAIIKGERDLEVMGEAESYTAGLNAVRARVFDLVIVDIGLGVAADGLELIKSIKAERRDIHILIVSIRDESVYAGRCLRAGAGGYLMKRDTTPESLLKALRHVLSNEIYLSHAMRQRVLTSYFRGSSEEASTAVDLLSDRELEVLHLVGEGVSMKEIASKLHFSPKTIQGYRERIRQKLAFADSKEFARFAHEWVATEGK